MLYFDTSALLPYYRQEASSASVQELLSALTEPILISHLTQVEVASALARWVRMGELDEAQANRIEGAMQEDLQAGRLRSQPILPEHFTRASHWLLTRRTALRSLDALHLACAEGLAAHLITEDTALLDAARHFGLHASTAAIALARLP